MAHATTARCERRSSAALMLVLSIPLALGGHACTSPETYYREDGTPYTKNEVDVGETILAFLLVGLLVWAANEAENPKPTAN